MKTRSDVKVIWVLIVWTVVNIAGFALAFYAVSRDFSGLDGGFADPVI